LSVLFILIGISILVAGSFLAAFLWSVKSGQYDDDYTPSVRMLFDDAKASPPIKKNQHTTKSKTKLCR
jgi:cbb3-type cytochrome oxidase maturation protein